MFIYSCHRMYGYHSLVAATSRRRMQCSNANEVVSSIKYAGNRTTLQPSRFKCNNQHSREMPLEKKAERKVPQADGHPGFSCDAPAH